MTPRLHSDADQAAELEAVALDEQDRYDRAEHDAATSEREQEEAEELAYVKSLRDAAETLGRLSAASAAKVRRSTQSIVARTGYRGTPDGWVYLLTLRAQHVAALASQAAVALDDAAERGGTPGRAYGTPVEIAQDVIDHYVSTQGQGTSDVARCAVFAGTRVALCVERASAGDADAVAQAAAHGGGEQ